MAGRLTQFNHNQVGAWILPRMAQSVDNHGESARRNGASGRGASLPICARRPASRWCKRV